MAKVLPINKDFILQGIENIEKNPSLRKGRESLEYDLVYNGKKYPPILVLSEANKLMGGQELVLSDFGNSVKTAFKIFNTSNFMISKKYPALNKDIVIEIIGLCNKMAEGRANGSLTQSTYTEKFRPFLDSFQGKFKDSPNLYLQNHLQNFYNQHLKNISDRLEFKNFGFWGRSIYNYVWSCI